MKANLINYIPHKLGKFAEDLACKHLKKRGLKLIARNYRCALGEIDLIMNDDSVFVFVEVRLRSVSSYIDGLESITFSKQQKIIRTASHYLQRNDLLNKVECRFDVISVRRDKKQFACEWVKQAFCDV